MIRLKEIVNDHSDPKYKLKEQVSGNQKAAKLAGSALTHEHGMKAGRWNDALQEYSDYFIRY